MVDSVKTWLERKSQINQDLKALAAQRQHIVAKERRAARAAERFWQLTSNMRRALLFIYEQSEWNFAPCVLFLKRVRASMRWPEMREQDMHALIQNEFLQCDLESLLTYNPNSDGNDCWARLAAKLVQEWNIITWGRDLNSHGVAPSTACMLEKISCHCDAAPNAVLKRTCFGRPSNVARTWACRFRQRWGAKLGRAKIADDMPLDVLRYKVSGFAKLRLRIVRGGARIWHRAVWIVVYVLHTSLEARSENADHFLTPCF